MRATTLLTRVVAAHTSRTAGNSPTPGAEAVHQCLKASRQRGCTEHIDGIAVLSEPAKDRGGENPAQASWRHHQSVHQSGEENSQSGVAEDLHFGRFIWQPVAGEKDNQQT